ncbi:pilus assembly protein CpaF [Microbacterium sp. cf046]|uniref:TadA family conjugal transfer-associated ATPase n=1 Tax=Microbacterium sp. cf046 TaxID=1761803 RepID=UPI0008F11BFE|nr:TadA family conjugal transfer-associated ATPase [Microbacterium sp. cf046]SFS16398.1 pilus assembly protein CpaF [Microbacterium sp. cf046]
MPDRFVVQPRTAVRAEASGPTRRPRAAPARSQDRPPASSAAGFTVSPLPVEVLPAEPVERPPVHPVLEPFARYLDDPDVTDLFVNGATGLFVDRGAGASPAREWRAREEDVRDLAVALIGLGGRHIDDATPCVDVQLDGGIRVHAVLPPVSAEGTAISIRIPRLNSPDLAALQARGMFDADTRGVLEDAVARRENLLITGAAGAGKTTLLAALLGCAPPSDRIVTIEDVAELRIRHPHQVRLEARQANLEGAGAIGLARLVREALRMRPDRLVVGECRGEEIRELLSALNTGHDGGAGTLHANSLQDVPARLEALGALAGLDDGALARQAASAIGFVLHVARAGDGTRRLAAAGRPVIGASGRVEIEEFSWPGR